MNPVSPSPDLRATAPEIARRFTLIMAALAALIIRAFLRNPRLIPIAYLLCNRLTRAARRFSSLMARVAANKHPRPRSHPGARRASTRKPPPPIPTGHAWLIRAIPNEAASYASQLAHLLAEPGVAELLAAVPTIQRILNPLRHALALTPPPARRARPSRARPTPVECRTPPRPLYPTLQAFRPFPPRLTKLKPG